jgi:hypothetical protein
MTLPNVFHFPGVGKTALERKHGTSCFYRRIAVRAPKKGEFFVSGAIPQVYRAENDLTMTYLIIVPTFYARRAIIPGEPVPSIDARD